MRPVVTLGIIKSINEGGTSMRLFSVKFLITAAVVLGLLGACTALPIPYFNGRSVYGN